jgi:O-antigen/teichoic acid export membrane protein
MQRFSLGMFYASLVAVFAVQIDSVVIGKLLTMSAVTAYAIAAKPYQMIQTLMMLAVRAIQPAAYNLRAANDSRRLEKLVSEGVRIRSITSIPVCVAAFLCMPPFIEVWVGSDYTWIVPWAQCFVLVPVFSCLGVGGQVCSTSSSGLVLANVIGTFRTGLNICISLYLISRLGIGGPILGTIISYALLGSLVMCYVYCRFMGISSRGAYVYFFKTTVVSILAGAFCYPVFQLFDEMGGLGLLIQFCWAALIQILFALCLLITSEERGQIIGCVRKLVSVMKGRIFVS